jgi:hypothetical protein
VCLSEANLPSVHLSMLETARAFVSRLVPATDAAAIFLQRCQEPNQAMAQVRRFFDEAAPEPLGQQPTPDRAAVPPGELCVLLAPPGDAGDRLRDLTAEALGEVELHTASGGLHSADDVLLYRETCNLCLQDLEHLGPAAHDAYVQMNRTDQFTPHSRIDVDFTGRKQPPDSRG